jgi:Site-specific recombinase XerD
MKKQTLLSDLLVMVCEFVDRQGYAKGTKYLYSAGMNNHRRHFKRCEQTAYASETAWEYVLIRRQEYENNIISYDTFLYTWKVFTMLEESYHTGKIIRRRSPVWGRTSLSAPYEALLQRYERVKLDRGYSTRTLDGGRSAVRQFFLYLEDAGIDSVSKIQRSHISGYIPILSRHNPAGISGILSRLRTFFRFLIEEGLIDENLLSCLQVTTAIRKKVRFGFSSDEADRILGAVDRSTPVGKRDFAMLLLARHTGLRAIDVLRLRMQDIDWNNNEIQIVQHKTKRPLILPLENHVGNAIADYILNARPDSKHTVIFLRAKAPYEALGHGNGTAITRRYAQKAGVTWGADEYKGFHSFRRSIGTNMLAASVPLHTISEILGHSHTSSTKPYLAADLENLKLCALPLDGYECTKEELL